MRSWRCSSRSTFLARKYTSNRYTERLAEAGLQASIGTVADSYDNTMAEAVNALFKTELVFWDGPWKGADDRFGAEDDVPVRAAASGAV
jgi:transposase InsO family protein